ncbi:unnamed protein product [Effrenium voratum]|uniref:Uncharacterized protein n=1 Tax=Effrenium voratum TaxID=2562239 RepID=A0AA36HWC5_9DINO|nr:unnamed protein product [Effrenium voratum]CAJ1425754.1 unnamed protein product [Effrenium voratum]CAJ1456167.1 unnamed protein product [Effrenium voratum]
MCTPKLRTGRADVSKEVMEKWKLGGESRRQLLDTLVEVKGDKEAFKKSIEVCFTKGRKNTIKISAGWYSKDRMKTVLGFGKQRIKAVVNYCSVPERKKMLTRYDKYEKNVREYWVQEQESGSFETTDEQQLRDTTVMAQNAETNQVNLAPPPSGPLSPPAQSSDDEQSMSEDEESGRPKKKTKKEKTGADFDQEHRLEATCVCFPTCPIQFTHNYRSIDPLSPALP